MNFHISDTFTGEVEKSINTMRKMKI